MGFPHERKLSSMSVLITGGAGFIGFHTGMHLLRRGTPVVAIDNLNSYYDVALKERRLRELQDAGGANFQFLKVDFSDFPSLSQALHTINFDRIIHLGAQAGVRYSIENPHAYVQSNLVGHLNLLEISRQRGIPMVYASSSSVYGGNDKLPFSVDDRVDHPLSLYAATKKSDELISESYSHLYRIPLTGLRFFTVYGPWGRPDMAMWLFTKAIFEDRPIQVFNNGNMRRDFTYIDDIVQGVLACSDSPPSDDGMIKAGGSRSPHRIYNIGNHRSENLLEMIEIIEEACGRKAVRELLPMQAGDVAETFADIEAISNDLGFQPTTTIKEGVPAFVKWYRDYHGA